MPSKQLLKSLSRNEDICTEDGLEIKTHPRCEVCSILIGEKHYEQRLYDRNGKKVCADCVKRRKV